MYEQKHDKIAEEKLAIINPCKYMSDKDLFTKISKKLNEEGKSIDLSTEAIQKEQNNDPFILKNNWSKKTIKILKLFIIDNPKPYRHT